MSPGQCPCPACGTTLRVRDRSFVGRQIECPDCHAKLVLKLNDDREFEAELFKAEVERPASRTSAPRNTAQPKASGNTRTIADALLSPLVVAWALGIGLTAFVAIMLLRPAVRFRPPSAETTPPVAETLPDKEATEPPEKTASDSVTQPPDPMPPSIVEKPPVLDVPPTPAEVTPPVPPATEKPAVVVTTPAETPKPVVPAPPKVDLEEVLKQRLSGFVTSSKKPTRRLDVIEQLDELTGHRIKFDPQELGEKKLMQTVSISVEVTTVGALLKLVLEPAGWEYVIEDEYLRLKPRQVAGTGTP